MTRRIWITGGAKGIGRAIAEAFVAAGDSVLITGRDEVVLAATAQALGDSVDWRAMNVADEASVQAGFAQESRVDVLVNNAGVAGAAPIGRETAEQWDRMMAVNARGVFLCSRAALALMQPAGTGRILCIASTASHTGMAYASAYTASKHAALGFMRSLASELAGSQITANSICPTYVDTEMTKRSIQNIQQKTGKSAAEARAMLEKGSPLGRLVRPDEIAAAALYLASPEAGAINGQSLILDGGGIQS